jgi:oligopeptide transport system ATP-binding protein
MDKDGFLEVRGLKKYFPIKRGVMSRVVGNVKAVDSITFSIREGETMGMVGESGCGKTTAGRTILRLLEPTEGDVFFEGTNVFAVHRKDLLHIRRNMQIIFQDPYSSLNPRMTVGGMLTEILKFHKLTSSAADTRDRVAYLLDVVGLSPQHASRYPHEFSGGQRQRIGVARALCVEPKFIVCDEPVSALDVSIQAQILNLLQDLQQKFNLTYLFIAHDLSVVEYISDRVAVMYLGKVVEITKSEELYKNPLHPYTRALLSAVPVPDPDFKLSRIVLTGDVPSPAAVPSGCPFHPRCFMAKDICKETIPELADKGSGHYVSCLLV